MMRAWPLALVVLVAAAGGAVRAAEWQTYVNDRFGATADVPAGWKAGEPPANDDGLSFTSPDGSASESVYGALAGIDSIAQDFAVYEEPNDGETITYRHRTKHWLVVSGTEGDRIFYRKWLLACRDQVWAGASLEYPASAKAQYDAIVEHVAKSLRQGRGYQMTDCL